MDAIVLAVLVVAVLAVVFGSSRARRRTAAQDAELTNGGMWGMSWLPAWLMIGGMSGHHADSGGDAGTADAGATDSFGDVFGGGGDFGGGAGGDFGGGAP
jgi:hypothetical protein